MTKFEKIQEAYGQHWKEFESHVSNMGWTRKSLIPFMEVKEIDFINNLQRPKSLNGLEDNNGWIHIKNDLPYNTECHFYDLNNDTYWSGMVDKFGDFSYSTKATHYQTIQKPNPPIY